VKVLFTGKLLNYEEICSLYHDCERMLGVHDPARLLLHLYLQVISSSVMNFDLSRSPLKGAESSDIAVHADCAMCQLQGYKDQYGDPSDQPSTLLNCMEVGQFTAHPHLQSPAAFSL
jgi:hypothetical protein